MNCGQVALVTVWDIMGWSPTEVNGTMLSWTNHHNTPKQATPDYAYGEKGLPKYGVLPNSKVRFEIEVIEFC
jgi:hypothetical protein